jgi:hypothetical protein
MTPVWQHATIIFQPYPDVGEFVNVGVLALAAPGRTFAFRLLPASMTARIRGFFPELDPDIYKEGRARLAGELNRIESAVNALPLNAPDGTQPPDARQDLLEFEDGSHESLFRALTAPRDGLFRFHPKGAILAQDAESALHRLFERYVIRVNPDHVDAEEIRLTQEVESWLSEWRLRRHYKKDVRVGTDAFRVKFPFAYQPEESEPPQRAIKPLNLSKSNSTEIYHHGDLWVSSLNRLKKFGQLPSGVLLPVKMPLATRGATRENITAAEDIFSQLETLKVTVANSEDRAKIREFAEIPKSDLVLRP